MKATFEDADISPESPSGAPQSPHKLAGDDDEGVNLIRVFSVALRQRWLVVGTAFVIVLTVIVSTALSRRQYTSSASFVSQGSKQGNAGLSSLAAQLGVTPPSGDATQSPAFYAYLLKSRPILLQAVNTTYVTNTAQGRRVTLTELYGAKGSTAMARQEGALAKLTAESKASYSRETGLVSFSVSSPWPEVSAQIADAVIGAVNKFNLQSRQTSAGAERRFVEKRLQEVAGELHDAENRLQQFKGGNRQFGLGSELTLERDRLAQQVTMRQQVYVSLAQAYEQAKIDEVRDTPVITIVESPRVPVTPDSRHMIRRVLLAGILGLLLGLLLAAMREYLGTPSLDRFPEFHGAAAAARKAMGLPRFVNS